MCKFAEIKVIRKLYVKSLRNWIRTAHNDCSHFETHAYFAKLVKTFVINRIVCNEMFDCSSDLLSMISSYTDCTPWHLEVDHVHFTFLRNFDFKKSFLNYLNRWQCSSAWLVPSKLYRLPFSGLFSFEFTENLKHWIMGFISTQIEYVIRKQEVNDVHLE